MKQKKNTVACYANDFAYAISFNLYGRTIQLALVSSLRKESGTNNTLLVPSHTAHE